jgi:4-hydroxybenzoate polyprenyltransferase
LRRRKPGDVPRAVISLIAGIALLDAILLSGAGHILFACLAVARPSIAGTAALDHGHLS